MRPARYFSIIQLSNARVRFTAEKEPLPEINEELEQIVEVMKDGYKKVFQTDGM